MEPLDFTKPRYCFEFKANKDFNLSRESFSSFQKERLFMIFNGEEKKKDSSVAYDELKRDETLSKIIPEKFPPCKMCFYSRVLLPDPFIKSNMRFPVSVRRRVMKYISNITPFCFSVTIFR